MAPSGRGRGSRGKARGSGVRGGRRGARRGTSGSPQTHTSHTPSRDSLIVTLRVRAPQHAHQLPTPASTALSPATPASQQQSEKESMAPVRDANNVEGTAFLAFGGGKTCKGGFANTIVGKDQIKDVIQHLFEVQSAVHGYLPETQGPLVEKMYASHCGLPFRHPNAAPLLHFSLPHCGRKWNFLVFQDLVLFPVLIHLAE